MDGFIHTTKPNVNGYTKPCSNNNVSSDQCLDCREVD